MRRLRGEQVRGHDAVQRAAGVQQPRGLAVQPHALRAEVRFDHLAHHRVGEARVRGVDQVGLRELVQLRRGLLEREPRQRGDPLQARGVAEHGDGAGHRERVVREPPDPRRDRTRDRARHRRSAPPRPRPSRPVNGVRLEQLRDEQRVPARGLEARLHEAAGSASSFAFTSAFTAVAGQRAAAGAGAWRARWRARPAAPARRPAPRAARRSPAAPAGPPPAARARPGSAGSGASAQCASSITSSSGCSAARLTASQYRPVERAVRGVLLDRPTAPTRTPARRARRAPGEQALPPRARPPRAARRRTAGARSRTRSRAPAARRSRSARAARWRPPRRAARAAATVLPCPAGASEQRHRPAAARAALKLRREALELRPALEQRDGAGRRSLATDCVRAGARPRRIGGAPHQRLTRTTPFGP